MGILDDVAAARRCSVPFISITTPDVMGTLLELQAHLEAESVDAPVALVSVDSVRGATGMNETGQIAAGRLANSDNDMAALMGSVDLVEIFQLAYRMPADSALFFLNAHRHLTEACLVQAIALLRDTFKAQRITLILLAPELTLPAELQHDVLCLDEPLPSKEALQLLVQEVYSCAREGLDTLPELDAAATEKAAAAAQGLSRFGADNAIAMSVEPTGLNLGRVWSLKEAAIEQTPGLSFYDGTETYAELGGLEQVKWWFARLFEGPMRPSAIVFIDEIEKMFGGLGGDLSGVSDDQLGCMLRAMQDYKWIGKIAVGPPGGGKSLIAKATGNTFGVPTVMMDLGATKGSLVGQSENQMRQMMKTVHGIGGEQVLFIATCNALSRLPPELKRRYGLGGVWFYDLATAEERPAIWKIQQTRYGLLDQALPEDEEGWTGAEIHNCCQSAYALGLSIREAAALITPYSRQDPESLLKLRRMAAQSGFQSASHPGPYLFHEEGAPEQPAPRTGRRFVKQ